MRALFDVNMLIALFDPGHESHPKANDWWRSNGGGGWASCPITQNGFLRVVSQTSYARPKRLSDALALLTGHIARSDHAFWHDDLSLLDASRIAHRSLLSALQLTDVYLLALAVEKGGRLVTLDRRVPLTAVRGAEAAHLVVV